MKFGIDIGGSHIGVGLIDNSGKILLKEEKDLVELKENYLFNSKQEEVTGDIIKQILIGQIVDFINKILRDTSIPIQSIEKIGIASPGKVKNGIIIDAGNLGIKEFNIVKELEKHYELPIILKNDAKCAGIAENKYGALKQYDNSVFITVGTGIGGAVFWHGELLEPKESAGFEVGHMVIEKGGKQCKCGNKGCFEQYASISTLKEMIRIEFGIEKQITGIELYNFIMENINEKRIKSILEKYIDSLAIGIANLINIFQPDAVCLGGSIVYYNDIILPKLIEILPKYCFDKNIPEVLMAKNKNDAGIIGAGA